MEPARTAYTLLGFALLPVLPLRLWWRGRRERGYRRWIGERFGRYRDAVRGPTFWIHAVSVGETRAAAPLVQRLKAAYPDATIVLTHMTAAGRDTGQALFGDDVLQAWLPYDVPFAVRAFYAHYRPAAGFLLETELWPNLIAQAHAQRRAAVSGQCPAVGALGTTLSALSRAHPADARTPRGRSRADHRGRGAARCPRRGRCDCHRQSQVRCQRPAHSPRAGRTPAATLRGSAPDLAGGEHPRRRGSPAARRLGPGIAAGQLAAPARAAAPAALRGGRRPAARPWHGVRPAQRRCPGPGRRRRHARRFHG